MGIGPFVGTRTWKKSSIDERAAPWRRGDWASLNTWGRLVLVTFARQPRWSRAMEVRRLRVSCAMWRSDSERSDGNSTSTG